MGLYDDGKLIMGAKKDLGEKLAMNSIIRTLRKTIFSVIVCLSVSWTEIFDVLTMYQEYQISTQFTFHLL